MRLFTHHQLMIPIAAILLISGPDGYSQEKIPGPDIEQKSQKDPPAPNIPKLNPVPAQLQVVPNLQVRQVVVNGFRTVIATSPEIKLEITDNNGKNITLKQSRFVGGKLETIEVKAEDLATLKRKSAEAAALYEKYALQPPAPARLQAQGEIRPLAPPAPILSEDNQTIPGQRKIRVDLADRKIEIFDSVDESILVKITKTVDGKPQVEEVTADSLRQLKNTRPEVYLLYKKYTGLKIDKDD